MAERECPYCPGEPNSLRHFFEAHPEIVRTWKFAMLDPVAGTVSERSDAQP